ncbi:ABC transporter ATP-binding protein/permease [Faecalimonas umbilicata]|nr:ABC transporter ATP-binding protein/permease [Faecalimonas umbilicata]
MKEQKNPEGSSLAMLISHWKNGTFSEIIEDWKWIFHYSIRYKGAIAVYVLLGILSTTLGLVGSVAGKYLIDIITGYQTSKLAVLAVIMAGSSMLSLLFDSLISRVSTKLSILINNDIQADVFGHIMDTDWLELNHFTNGDLLNRFNGDIKTVSGNAISWLPTVILSIYKFVATFFVILHYDWVMAVIAMGSAPFLLASSRLLIKKQRDYSREVREMSSHLMTFEAEAFYNLDTIKSFGITDRYNEKMHGWQEKFKEISLKYNLFTIKANAALSVLGMLVQFVAFGYCLFRLWTRDITYGTMTLFLQQRSSLSAAFHQMASLIPGFLSSSVSARRIREIMELPREEDAKGHEWEEMCGEGEWKVPLWTAGGLEVRMENVEFSYVQGKKVIGQSQFRACPGEIVALVGPSGEGKTTMVRLILGLIRPEAGKVFLIKSGERQIEAGVHTRQLFAYVPQGNTILTGTIAENMRMVREDATDGEIIEALKTACAWEFVEKLPKGIHSSVGEKGRGLSEGQAQRIAIARAVLRECPVLLLDEATSALDVATERRVLKNLISRDSGRTCIVTTHRPSVLSMCRRVYRVMDTKITELSEDEAGQMAMDF